MQETYHNLGKLLSEGGFVDAAEDIEKKGTEGKFTAYCGGKVTDACIKRALKEGGHPAKMAQFAKAARSVAKKRTDESLATQSATQRDTKSRSFERAQGQKTSSKRFGAGKSKEQSSTAAAATQRQFGQKSKTTQ